MERLLKIYREKRHANGEGPFFSPPLSIGKWNLQEYNSCIHKVQYNQRLPIETGKAAKTTMLTAVTPENRMFELGSIGTVGL